MDAIWPLRVFAEQGTLLTTRVVDAKRQQYVLTRVSDLGSVATSVVHANLGQIPHLVSPLFGPQRAYFLVYSATQPFLRKTRFLLTLWCLEPLEMIASHPLPAGVSQMMPGNSENQMILSLGAGRQARKVILKTVEGESEKKEVELLPLDLNLSGKVREIWSDGDLLVAARDKPAEIAVSRMEMTGGQAVKTLKLTPRNENWGFNVDKDGNRMVLWDGGSDILIVDIRKGLK